MLPIEKRDPFFTILIQKTLQRHVRTNSQLHLGLAKKALVWDGVTDFIDL